METARDIVTNILDRLGISYHDVSHTTIADQEVIKVAVDDTCGDQLIGKRGEVIRALDYVVKRIAEQKGMENARFLVDINGYRIKQIEDLQQKARMMADRARSFQYDVELTPMSAYERLIVHTTLADSDDVKTESHGEGRNRRVVIKYGTQRQP